MIWIRKKHGIMVSALHFIFRYSVKPWMWIPNTITLILGVKWLLIWIRTPTLYILLTWKGSLILILFKPRQLILFLRVLHWLQLIAGQMWKLLIIRNYWSVLLPENIRDFWLLLTKHHWAYGNLMWLCRWMVVVECPPLIHCRTVLLRGIPDTSLINC